MNTNTNAAYKAAGLKTPTELQEEAQKNKTAAEMAAKKESERLLSIKNGNLPGGELPNSPWARAAKILGGQLRGSRFWGVNTHQSDWDIFFSDALSASEFSKILQALGAKEEMETIQTWTGEIRYMGGKVFRTDLQGTGRFILNNDLIHPVAVDKITTLEEEWEFKFGGGRWPIPPSPVCPGCGSAQVYVHDTRSGWGGTGGYCCPGGCR